MNICFVPPIIAGTVSGGVNTQIEKTAEYLEQLNHKVTFFNQWEKYDWEQFDIVHIFRADSTNLELAQWLHNNQIPFVVSPIFFSLHKPSKIKKAIQFTELCRKILSGITSDLLIKKDICHLSSQVLPNTQDEANLICASMKLNSDKTSVIPNGIDIEFKNSKPDLFYKKYGVKDFILSTGHFGFKRKNLISLLKATKDINVPLVLIGSLFDDEYSSQCKTMIEKSNNTIWIDTLNHSDPLLASAYSAAKVFALPSLYETPGLSALEAAICGCNIVITPYGGTKEYFKDYAVYPEPLDINQIRNAIEKSLAVNNDSSLSKNIINNYNWNKVAEKTVEAYKKVISSK